MLERNVEVCLKEERTAVESVRRVEFPHSPLSDPLLTVPAMPELTDTETQILEFERHWWKYADAKENAVRAGTPHSAPSVSTRRPAQQHLET